MNGRPDSASALAPITMAKVVLALVGAVVFGAGIRWESSALRWAGLALVAVGWLLRLVGGRRTAAGEDDPPVR